MTPLTDQAVFILAGIGAIAVLGIAMILLSWTTEDEKRNRRMRAARAGALGLIFLVILLIAWRVKNG
ncbi:hypothetical protein [Falsirhodobacter sp. 20TX0035]|uniref:hypothetical protein n=1 Tax=Falsirhodobacter sp. 20TX0035 TaxID=3022019 RepID=UPI0023309E21|nr:hypothetical protein [Falsirhodobacter sp. 20TX0035]MDB6454607.1 hypothetical protein [Falsirhodobacter sp. 20TX0035]